MRNVNRASLLSRTSVLLGALALCYPAFGQAADPETPDEDAVSRQETIVVTATKRQTTLENTPVAVTAVSGADLQEAGVGDTQSIQALVPSLTVTTSTSETGGAAIRLRGVGTNANNFGIEPSIGVFVDGVYFNRSGIALNDLFDIDNVQVLRGPQSTLFGKNTSGGAILINTKAPVFETEGEIKASAGNYEMYNVSGIFNTPVVEDVLAIRVGGQYHSRDGYMEDINTSRTYHDRDRWLVRGQALWEPTSDLSIRLNLDAASKDEACCAPTLINDSSPRTALIRGLGGEVGDVSGPYATAVNSEIASMTDEFGASVTVKWDISDNMDLSFIGAHRDFEGERKGDVDFSSLGTFEAPFQRLESTVSSAEVYLNGRSGRVDWLVGAFYLDESLVDEGATVFGEDAGAFFSSLVPASVAPLVAASYPVGGGQTQTDYFQDGEAFSLYTHNVIDLTENTSLTLGLRYSDDSKTGGGRFETTNNPSCGLPAPLAALRIGCPVSDYDAEYEDSTWSGTIALLHHFTDSTSVFGSISNGYKSGGINFERTAGDTGNSVIGSEQSDNYEIGIRTEPGFWDSNLSLIAFYTKYTDFQVNVLNPTTGTFVFSNEGEVTSEGAELEWSGRPMTGLDLNASVTYAHARFADDVANETFAGGPPNNSPDWTVTAGGRYARRLTSDLRGYVSINARWQSELYTSASLDPNSEQDPYTLVNMRLGLMQPAQGWEVAAWMNNALDEEYKVISFPTPQQPGNWSAFMGEPRMYGVTVSKTF